MLGMLTKATCPIGIDLDRDVLRMAQLATVGKDMTAVDLKCVSRPPDIPPDSPQWQRWAIDAIHDARAQGRFRGKDAVVALPPDAIFVDVFRGSEFAKGKHADTAFAKIKPRVPKGWTPDNTVIQCLPTEQDNVIVMAAERAIVDRHLAVYERARLVIRSMAVWPLAMANCHARFFARRGADVHSVVMLLDIQSGCSNIAVCRGGSLLSARSIPIGAQQLQTTGEAGKLAWELMAVNKQLQSAYRDVRIERLILLSGVAVDPEVCRTIGAELTVRVQLGDCRTALGIETASAGDDVQTNWTLAFGLSLC